MRVTFCLLITLVVALFAVHVRAQQPSLPNEDWGYVTVDFENNANLFWLFNGATQHKRDNAPTILWLQGGPGASSLLAAFCEIGPIDACRGPTAKPREYSWTNHSNIIFVDQPVGTGFSYVENDAGYVTNEKQLAAQLLILLQSLVKRMPKLRTNPFWVFSESYGAKMAAHFGNAIKDAIADKKIDINFQGVALGDGWVSPQECVSSYGDYLQAISHLDSAQAAHIDSFAESIRKSLEKGEYLKATELWGQQQDQMVEYAAGINVYDFLQHTPYNYEFLTKYVNTVLREKLQIIPKNITWNKSSSKVFNNLREDFMQSAVDQVEDLLNAGYKVAVFTGQLDVIVNILSTERWARSMDRWNALSSWVSSPKHPIVLNGQVEGFRKQYKNFDFWWILNAGHLVPMDNPKAALHMLTEIVAQ